MRKLLSILLCVLLLAGFTAGIASAENKFCPYCGEAYPAEEGYAFCPNCGHALPDEDEETPAAVPITDVTAEEEAEETSQENDGLTEYLLSELNSSVYRETWQALKEGDPLKSGAYGDAARGLQQTLIDFGQKLSADGQAGGQTFEALHAVQDAFGLQRTDTVDADTYSDLLLRLLAMKELEEHEPYEVEDMLCELPGAPVEYEESIYLVASAYYLKGKYYHAEELFTFCDWADAQERAETCRQPWPSTGQIWKDPSLSAGTQLTVTVNGQPDVGMHVKIYQRNGTDLAAALFIGGSGSASTWLPGGTYVIKDGTGTDWYGPEDSFGGYGSYETMTFDDDDATEVELESGYTYTISINVTESTGGTGVGSEYEPYGTF